MTTRRDERWSAATRMVHDGSMRSPHGETSEALFLTQGFVYDGPDAAEARFKGEDDGYIYSRYGNPTVTMFEERLASLEGAEACRATASGMAAVTAALQCMLSAGDHLIAARQLFGSCRWVCSQLLPRMGVETTLVDGTSLDEWEAALRPNTRAMFLESPTNPNLALVDIASVAELANRVGATVMVDNVFATPIHQSPLELGAHVVVYSTTKHIDGQGRCLGGAILSSQDWVDEHLHDYFRHTGPSMSPFNAWVMLKGLETLHLRVGRQTQSAAVIADALAADPAIGRVLYPGRDDHPQAELARRQMRGASTLVAFEVAGGKAGAFALADALELVLTSNNLGDAKTLITHPATTTHKNLLEEERLALGITDGMLRLSVGLEEPDDLLADLHAGCRAADRAGRMAA